MKKNKGFTLAELLVIILIVGLLISITGYTVTRVLKQTKENIKEQELKSLVDASKTYLNQVIDGQAEYNFTDKNYSGYDFLAALVEKCSSYDSCSVSNDVDPNKYEVELYVSLYSVRNYIDETKYNEGKCNMTAYIEVSVNSKGYYVLEKLDVKPASSTKAKTCVISE